MTGFVGIHIGAGNHSEKLQIQYEEICKAACKKGLRVLTDGGNAVDAVACATATLEDCPLTNSGVGSNLTWDGDVECDASLMDGDQIGFGAAGAIKRVKNPILLAKRLCLAQFEPLSLGRVPSCLLVSDGAEKWAEKKGLEIIDPQTLISSKSFKTYKKYKSRAESCELKVTEGLLDTVGAVALDLDGKVAAACSSGGILLKQPGRVGQAAMWGCGCWAERRDGRRVAVSASGCGEDIMRTGLSRQTASYIFLSDNPTTSITTSLQSFIDSPYLPKDSQRLCGVIALDYDRRGEFAWAHTTPSMIVGYMSSKDSSPHCRVSRLPPGIRPGSTVLIQGVPF